MSSGVNPASATDNSPGVYLSGLNPIPAGGTLVVRINVDDINSLGAYQISLRYDPDVLSVIGEEGGKEGVHSGIIGDTYIPVVNWCFYPLSVQGNIRILGYLFNKEVSGSGYLAEVYFKVTGQPGSQCAISPGNVAGFSNSLFSSQGNKIENVNWWNELNISASASLEVFSTTLPAGFVGVEYQASLLAIGGLKPYQWQADGLPRGLSISDDGIISGTPEAAPELNEKSNDLEIAVICLDSSSSHDVKVFPFCIMWIAGDANGDGQIDLGDMIKVDRILSQRDAATPGADINYDRLVDDLDSGLIQRVFMGLDSPP